MGLEEVRGLDNINDNTADTNASWENILTL